MPIENRALFGILIIIMMLSPSVQLSQQMNDQRIGDKWNKLTNLKMNNNQTIKLCQTWKRWKS